MYLTDLPINIVKRTYPSYTNSTNFKVDLLNIKWKINVKTDHSINAAPPNKKICTFRSYILGIKQLVTGVNKMEDKSENYSR